MPSTVIKNFIDYMQANPEFEAAFRQSFELAHSTGIEQFDHHNIHNVDDYLKFMNEYLNWVPREGRSGGSV